MSFDHLLARQGGVVTLAQAAAHGISASTVRRRARDGSWTWLRPGVYLVGGHRFTNESEVRAAGLWAGDRASVSGPAAAFWHGMLSRPPSTIEVTVPVARKPRPQPGIRLRRRDLHVHDRVNTADLWVTGKALTVLETATALSQNSGDASDGSDGSVFLDRALQRHVTFPTLYRAYCRNIGCQGNAAAARLLAAAADRADSAAERMLIGLLRGAGLSGWVTGHPFGPYRIDLAFPIAKLAVEVDGWAWHVDAHRFATDRQKGNALVRAGWLLLRFTWHDLHHRPADCLAQVREALAQAA